MNDFVLSAIDAGAPATHLKLAIEFEHAPSLTMLRLPQPFLNSVSSGHAVDIIHNNTPDVIPPLENDNVMCRKHEDGGIILPGDAGFEMPTFNVTMLPAALTFVPGIPVVPSGTNNPSQYIQIKRVSGAVSELRLGLPATGVPPNSIMLTMSLDGLEFEYRFKDVVAGLFPITEEHAIAMAKLEMSCLAFAGPALTNARGCGEIPMTCVSTSARISGLAGTLPTTLSNVVLPPGQNNLALWPGWHTILEDVIRQLLARGVRLHFSGFSASALTIDSTLNVRLLGTPSSNCSHTPPPPPPPAPVRGLARVSSSIGMGEFVGDRGSVIPFDLIPEVKIDWVTPTGNPPFMPFTAFSGVRGAELTMPERPNSVKELPAFLPTGLDVSLELTSSVANACWTKPTQQPPNQKPPHGP